MIRALCIAFAIVAAAGCAKGHTGADDDGDDDDTTVTPDASGPVIDGFECGEFCDDDGDGVVDGSDQCPDTPSGEAVNQAGCSDSQVDPTLEPTFPPFGLTWTPTGDAGRAGGLTWTYTGISHLGLFHIYWVVCDEPAEQCGVSLDGAIDVAAENWQFSGANSNLPAGRLVFLNSTHILLDDGSSPAVSGKLTVTLSDGSNPVPFAALATLGVTGRDGEYGAEISGAGFAAVITIEVHDASSSVWTPYLDYYDAAPTPGSGGSTAVSFGGSFYSE